MLVYFESLQDLLIHNSEGNIRAKETPQTIAIPVRNKKGRRKGRAKFQQILQHGVPEIRAESLTWVMCWAEGGGEGGVGGWRAARCVASALGAGSQPVN